MSSDVELLALRSKLLYDIARLDNAAAARPLTDEEVERHRSLCALERTISASLDTAPTLLADAAG